MGDSYKESDLIPYNRWWTFRTNSDYNSPLK
jgi:hypothetical protein